MTEGHQWQATRLTTDAAQDFGIALNWWDKTVVYGVKGKVIMNDLERELRKMTKAEFITCHNILVANTRVVDANPTRTANLLKVVK